MILKDIKGFEGLYAVTADGRVWSYLRNKWLKPLISSSGYYNVALHKDGRAYRFLIHRLVYETFKGLIPKEMTVDHIDSNRLNNTLDNLQLLTQAENTRKANKGKKRTEEAKQKMSKVKKGENNPMFGRKHSDETRRKMSEGCKKHHAKRKLNA